MTTPPTKNVRKYVLIVSILLHVLVLAFVALALEFNWFAGSAEQVGKLNKEPLVFELERDDTPKEVVETPEDAEVKEPPEEADLLSDKNTKWRNPEVDPKTEVGDAYFKGDLDVNEVPRDPSQMGEQGELADRRNQQEQVTNKDASEKPDEYASNSYTQEFKREYLVDPKQVTNVGSASQIPKVRYDNRDSRAPDMGGFSLNTYEWEWAPYLLRVKKKVEPNIFPPPAFYRMGLINGETLLRFKIMPSGEMRDLEILEYDGHVTLMQTSENAIEISAPFEALPEDFPEPYLEITAKFIYYLNKRN